MRIGYVDLELENYHSNIYLQIARGEHKALGFEIAGAWAINTASGKEWCAKNDVPWFDSVAAMDAHVDVYCVLAPGAPEAHMQLCEATLPMGKPTYVDKTFAPDLATAQAIFALADKHGAAVQTTSALRYTNVHTALAELGGPSALRHMVTWGGGSSFGEYAIHPVELAVSCMGSEAESVHRRADGELNQILVNFSGGRTLVANVYCQTSTGFAASLTTAETTQYHAVDNAIFVDSFAGLAEFWSTGVPNIPRAESLAIRAILDAANDPAALAGYLPISF